jgi:luciferase family oxidoreductase group 1
MTETVSGIRLNVLDQSPIPEGLTAADALQNTLDLARHADRLGFGRYWLAEHHGTPGLACNSPEVLIGPVAAATQNMRVGSGGVMLPHYSPLKVAENFGMLSNLYPNRIDLGIGRAAGTSRNVAFALQRDRRQQAPDDFQDQLQELLGYFSSAREDRTSLQISDKPQTGSFVTPEVWLLGSSPQSGIWAAEMGLPYCFADFINPQGSEISQYYQRAFQASAIETTPRAAVALWAICAETDEEAEELSLSARMMMAMLARGRLIAVPTVERARQFVKEEQVSLDLLAAGRRFIAGSPSKVRAQIENVAKQYGAEEVFLVNILHDHQARRRSYELIAAEFDLKHAGKSFTKRAS